MEKAKKQAAKAGETITISREEYERLLEENSALNRRLDWLMEQLRLMRTKKYGPSSEKRLLNEDELCEQLSLVFNEAEAYQPREEKKRETQVVGYTRTKRSSRVEEILPENVPVEVVEHRIPEGEQTCPDCGSRMEEIGKEVRRRAGYHRLGKEIQVVGCWAHARRKFDEAVKCLPKEKQGTAAANEGLQYCNALFSLEKEFAKLSAEERYVQRQKKAKPVMEALFAWCEGKHAPPKSGLGKALYYLREQKPYLEQYLEDGRLEISNNRAERSMKPFVIDRKNFLFANTPNGAQGSAIIFSLIETAKENGLDPYRYLVYVLSTAPGLADGTPDWAEKLLPEYAPVECRAAQSNKN